MRTLRMKMGVTKEPRSLLELDVQQAISSILQKPRWWIKRQDPEICTKWMGEVEQQLLLKSFEQSLVGWSRGQAPLEELSRLMKEPSSSERRTKLSEWLTGIVTEFVKRAESEDEDSDVESDNEDSESEAEDSAKQEEERLHTLREEVESQKAYPTIKWTFNQLLLHERLSAVPVEEWSHETIGDAINSAVSVADPSLAPRATEFVLAVRRGVTVEEALPLPPGSKLLSADRLLKLKLHCAKIQGELAAVRLYMMEVLKLVAEKEGLDADTDPNRVVICPACIEGVWFSDSAISGQVAAKFKGEVAVLETVPDEQKDWHPHSNKQVLDLVHPSLFCGVFGQTLRASSALDPSSFATPLEQMQRVMFTGTKVVKRPEECYIFNTDYQWIPTDFLLAEGGEPGRDGETVRCLSYINNLHPAQHGDLYDSISVILGRFVPLFERMLSDRAAGTQPPTFNVDMFSHDSWSELPRRPRVPDEAVLPGSPLTVSLRGKTVQVIVKIAEILLTPEKPKYFGGVWHIEGQGRAIFRIHINEGGALPRMNNAVILHYC